MVHFSRNFPPFRLRRIENTAEEIVFVNWLRDDIVLLLSYCYPISKLDLQPDTKGGY